MVTTFRQRVLDVVRSIPTGKVATYGQVALLAGNMRAARQVGAVLYDIGEVETDVPWQRVINAQGKCSTGRLTIPMNLQQDILESEGVEFNAAGKCDLNKYQWYPKGLEPEEDVQPSLLT